LIGTAHANSNCDKVVLGENERRVDFDKDKVQDLTFAKWAEIYLERYGKVKRSSREDERHVKVLAEFFGPLPLQQIPRTKVEEFKQFVRTV
jgi:hypothetical protein